MASKFENGRYKSQQTPIGHRSSGIASRANMSRGRTIIFVLASVAAVGMVCCQLRLSGRKKIEGHHLSALAHNETQQILVSDSKLRDVLMEDLQHEKEVVTNAEQLNPWEALEIDLEDIDYFDGISQVTSVTLNHGTVRDRFNPVCTKSLETTCNRVTFVTYAALNDFHVVENLVGSMHLNLPCCKMQIFSAQTIGKVRYSCPALLMFAWPML
jgi:hypothetical protein